MEIAIAVVAMRSSAAPNAMEQRTTSVVPEASLESREEKIANSPATASSAAAMPPTT